MAIEEKPAVAILCGGRGTRLQEHTEAIPKPLVEIGGWPIVWHVIQIYARRAFAAFVLCWATRASRSRRFVVRASRGRTGVDIECVDTGLDTPTGGRLKQLRGPLGRRDASAPPTPTAWPTWTWLR